MNFNELKLKLINGNIDFNNFDCGNNDLNEFLKNDSIFQKELLLNTTIIFYRKSHIIAFLTISSDTINIKRLGKKYKKKFQDKNIIYKNIPSIKIGRLAVDKKFQNDGIGDYIIIWLFY